MSSSFDTEVYAERQRLPGVTISLSKLLTHLMWAREGWCKATISAEYRQDVDTGEWWTVSWGDQSAEGKTLDLALFRAAVIARRTDERAKKYAGMAEPQSETGASQ